MNPNDKPAGPKPGPNRPKPNGPRPNRNGQPKGPNGRGNRPNDQKNNSSGNGSNGGGRGVSRGAAIRALRRVQDFAQEKANDYLDASNNKLERRANVIPGEADMLKITFLGGQDGIGEKNMQIFEWQNSAIVVDCGNELGIDLPGVNYAIADPTYLESIAHKLKGYFISHGHLDHLGGLKHIVPKVPAPIYGSRFTLGVVEKSFEDAAAESGLEFKPELNILNMDNHERIKVGDFFVELVRITHSVPESSCVVVDTPVGRVINTGDWRLDPEPLDELPSDVTRLKQLGDEGVLLLMSDSTGANLPGRTPTEHTLQQSFHDLIDAAEGRVFVAIFSSNMNRIQMIVNAAVKSGRRVALDGRSMMSYAEIAVRQGILKIPKGTVLPMREMPNIPENQVLVVCTGGQGEPGAALQRMSEGEHKHIKLKEGDTVIVSSTPIPGNEIRYEQIGNNLAGKGVHLFRAPTAEVDGCGPLHVSGHAKRDEHRELMHIVRPKFFAPIYAGTLNRRYHAEMAIEEGWARNNVLMADNGDTFALTADKFENIGQVPHGSMLVDQTGSIVPNVVVKDRLMLSESGLVVVVLTIDKKSGQLMTSPDIVSRGFIYMRDNEELMNNFRIELRRAVQQRFKRIDLDRFKVELKDHVTHFLYEQTGRSPIVIPVVNIVNGAGGRQGGPNNGNGKRPNGDKPEQPQSTVHEPTPEEIAAEQQKRFEEMRARLLGADQPD